LFSFLQEFLGLLADQVQFAMEKNKRNYIERDIYRDTKISFLVVLESIQGVKKFSCCWNEFSHSEKGILMGKVSKEDFTLLKDRDLDEY